MVPDLVNFMTRMSEPNQITRKQVGRDKPSSGAARSHVLLYKEFWKDVH
jgi:hypothetical protein